MCVKLYSVSKRRPSHIWVIDCVKVTEYTYWEKRMIGGNYRTLRFRRNAGGYVNFDTKSEAIKYVKLFYKKGIRELKEKMNQAIKYI
jgi:hypothetical protein